MRRQPHRTDVVSLRWDSTEWFVKGTIPQFLALLVLLS
jgi:hypothetical protein